MGGGVLDPSLPGLLGGASEGFGSGRGTHDLVFSDAWDGGVWRLQAGSLLSARGGAASAPRSGAFRHPSKGRDLRSGPENPHFGTSLRKGPGSGLHVRMAPGQWFRLAAPRTGTPPAGRLENVPAAEEGAIRSR